MTDEPINERLAKAFAWLAYIAILGIIITGIFWVALGFIWVSPWVLVTIPIVWFFLALYIGADITHAHVTDCRPRSLRDLWRKT